MADGSVYRVLGRSIVAIAVAMMFGTAVRATADPPGAGQPLRIAVYEAPPYGSLGSNGLFDGASVDLWRRVAEDRHWPYRLQAVSRMDDVLAGLEAGRFDAAIGAITITPERLARVDFSYPTHRSGVTAVFAKQTGVAAALSAYGAVAGQLGMLLATMVAMLLAIGVVVWLFERGRQNSAADSAKSGDSAITSLAEGIYWAVVTMTTVGYGDKTPKTHAGRVIAIVWMLGSVALISLLSTSIVAQLTADRIVGRDNLRQSDLVGKRLAAVTGSSGAEYLTSSGLAFARFASLDQALDALAHHRTDAVVNSVGALEHEISARYASTIELPRGLLAPALMGMALPAHSALKGPLDQSLVKITTSPEWAAIEARYFGR